MAVLGLSVWGGGNGVAIVVCGWTLNRNDYRSPTTNYTITVYGTDGTEWGSVTESGRTVVATQRRLSLYCIIVFYFIDFIF